MKIIIKTQNIDFCFENDSTSFDGCNILVKDICSVIEKVCNESKKLSQGNE